MKRPSGLQWGLPKIVSLAVPDELAHRPAREVLHQQALRPVEVRQERELLPVRREVGLVLGRAVRADAAGRLRPRRAPPRSGSCPVRFEVKTMRWPSGLQRARPSSAGSSVRRRSVPPPAGTTYRSRLPATSRSKTSSQPGGAPPLAAGAGGGAARRPSQAAAAAATSRSAAQRRRSGSHGASAAAYSSAAVAWPSVPFALATSVALTKSSRSPSSTRSGLPVSCFVRWSLTMR